ncbi:MAG: tRNA pseudouridine(55) synthase TruB [Oscillospiraceae bacterium]|nr:tRNA pseudouridine(55) synthase TruB [Oscillospiraceae bacterium]
MDGILVIDKPKAYTSFDVVAVMRKLCGEKKIGHTGTLDPMATGVLPILVGKATRCAPFIDDTDKEYEAEFQLGLSTDTQDITGTVVSKTPHRVTREEIEAVLPRFRGEILQLPPMYSAVQIDGKRLYSLARQGIEVEREKRPVTIYQCDLLSFDEETQRGRLLIMCSKGTYIRTLCSDIGQALGSLGVLTSLRRTVACGFSLRYALPLEKAREIVASGGSMKEYLLPIEAVFADVPKVKITAAQMTRFCNGGALSLERTKIPPADWLEGRTYRVISPEEEFLGLGQISRKNDELKILRLFYGAP